MRLYKLEIIEDPACFKNEQGIILPVKNTEAWIEFCMNRPRGEVEDYYSPSESKFFKSRSSVAERVASVEFWGGKARILEAQVSKFVPIEEANARRKAERDQVRIAKLEAQIRKIKEGGNA